MTENANKSQELDEKHGSSAATSPLNSSAGTSKSFRHQSDIEFFYRFVHENDLRQEAIDIFRKLRTKKRHALAHRYRNNQSIQ